jgi:hypothetical protein
MHSLKPDVNEKVLKMKKCAMIFKLEGLFGVEKQF